METNVWLAAAVWMGLALAASVISIRIGISVALIEILVGIVAGNFLHVQTAPWIDFLATFGAGLLTFLAGAEIDPDSLRRHLRPALVIGAVGFFAPFLATLIAQRFFQPAVPATDLGEEDIAAPPFSTPVADPVAQ